MSVLATKSYLLFRVVPRFVADRFGPPGKYTLGEDYFFTPRTASFAAWATRNLTTVFWNLDLLLLLWIKAHARFSLLLHQLAKTGQDKFAGLFNLFVGERAKSIQEYSRGSFVGLGGFGKCALKFILGHLWPGLISQTLDTRHPSSFKPARTKRRYGRSPVLSSWVALVGVNRRSPISPSTDVSAENRGRAARHDKHRGTVDNIFTIMANK
jgi:hypothetical protein